MANRITKWMYGTCIEDVNPEIYGGLYAQKIFGESFEEPPPALPPSRGCKAYDGQWKIEGGVTTVAADAGAKVVRNEPVVRDGSVECEVRFADDKGENAAAIQILKRNSDGLVRTSCNHYRRCLWHRCGHSDGVR